jgi:hypothetical protein
VEKHQEAKMDFNPEVVERKQGFEGAILGLPLADVLQLQHQNRFSGCVTLTNGDRKGKLYFRSGAIIHAELPDCEGEDACYRMLSWRGGHFTSDMKINTTRHTIDKPLSFLLLEACRLMDEKQLVQDEPPPSKPGPSADQSSYITSVLAAFDGVPQVCGAAVTDRQGVLLFSRESLDKKVATDGEFLSLIGKRLGQLLSAGDLQHAVFASVQRRVVSVHSRGQALHVSFEPEESPASAVDIVRSTLKRLKKE